MRHLLLLLMLILPLSLSAETSPTLKLAHPVAVSIGPRQVLLSDGELSDHELSTAKSRYVGAKYDQMVENARRQKMAKAIVDAAVKQFCQEREIRVTDEEVSAWVKSVRTRGAENRTRDVAKYEADLKAKEAEIAAAAGDDKKLSQLNGEKLKMEQTLAALRDAFKMDDKLAELYPSMGLMFLESWKSRQALVNEFGGRVYQLNGSLEPLDAVEALIEKQKKDGTFTVKDPYADTVLAEYFGRRPNLRALEPVEGKKALNDKSW